MQKLQSPISKQISDNRCVDYIQSRSIPFHNWSVEDTKSYTNFPELARDMPQVWTCKFNSEHEWSNNFSNTHGVTKSPTALLRRPWCVAQLDDTRETGEHSHPEGCLWKNNNHSTKAYSLGDHYQQKLKSPLSYQNLLKVNVIYFIGNSFWEMYEVKS